MGWFWADDQAQANSLKRQYAPHGQAPPNASPPPGCPMHDAPPPQSIPPARPPPEPRTQSASACPVKRQGTSPAMTPSTSQKSSPDSTIAALNPLNYMPSDLSQSRESSSQTITLPVDRETSSIPRGTPITATASADESKWVYPSPQQMYNAMLRKGYTDTPTDAVEAMVAVHNFLNEGAWAEILEWERRFSRGLRRGWQLSRFGEDGSVTGAMIDPGLAADINTEEGPRLLRFMGRKDAMTPKAQLMQAAGWVAPGYFGGPPPFDRHDWFIERRGEGAQTKEVRYVIDYYSAGTQETGEPVFYLDIRPAVDGPSAAAERLIRWTRDIWWKGSGGQARWAEK